MVRVLPFWLIVAWPAVTCPPVGSWPLGTAVWAASVNGKANPKLRVLNKQANVGRKVTVTNRHQSSFLDVNIPQTVDQPQNLERNRYLQPEAITVAGAVLVCAAGNFGVGVVAFSGRPCAFNRHAIAEVIAS